eukprot:CAMPEP_0174743328 /NCGR_PEP_ID=MMETSP1094-20130205/81348_1 /TAXON_ID=156173 /ORGANISM="Chrysochromulina brevifilum, Strain UTEX LB 985" /LENGTH=75 /DNA_ID=CAMNT_0015947531 /DNA_START=36 /DNA_END=262 /DNA_ORIENTATION=+
MTALDDVRQHQLSAAAHAPSPSAPLVPTNGTPLTLELAVSPTSFRVTAMRSSCQKPRNCGGGGAPSPSLFPSGRL